MTTGIDFRSVAHCAKCQRPHPVVRFHAHTQPLVTEHGVLDSWYECLTWPHPQVAVRGSDYPPAWPETGRAARLRRAS